MIYLDNAATTLHKPPEMMAAMADAVAHMANEGRGGHGATLDAGRIIYRTRQKLATLFGVENPLQIAFTSNATHGLNIAIGGIVRPGDHVVSTQWAHNSVLRPLQLAQESGATVTYVPADSQGDIAVADIIAACTEETKAIVLTHASNLTGTVIDLTEIGMFARRHGICLILDAAQTAGVYPIDVVKQNIDVLCFTGHKGLMGPQGTGGIYVREGISVSPLMVGGSGVHSYDKHHPTQMPTALEAGTLNGHGIGGLGGALDFIAQVGVKQIRQREMALMERFLTQVERIDGVTTYGTRNLSHRVAIVTLNIRDYDSNEMCDYLWQEHQIAVRGGAHCAPMMHQALGTVEQGAVRFAFAYFNTEEEVDAAAEAVRQMASEE